MSRTSLPLLVAAVLALPSSVACDQTSCVIPPSLEGELVIADEETAAFSTATWSGVHKQDIDADEDGCLSNVTVVFAQGEGSACTLTVNASPDGDGGWRVFAVDVTADSNCRDFPDDREGSYLLSPDSAPVSLTDAFPLEIPEDNVASSCFDAEVGFDGVATLEKAGDAAAPTLTIDFSGVTLRGALATSGSDFASCSEP